MSSFSRPLAHGALAIAAWCAFATPSDALAWPAEPWETRPECEYSSPTTIDEPIDTNPKSIDLVGAPPTFYDWDPDTVPYAEQKVYFRIDLLADPSGQGGQGAWQQYAWYVLVETNQEFTSWDFRMYLGGITEVLVFEQNLTQQPDWCQDVADTPPLAYYNTTTDVQVTFNPVTGRYFLDLQMPRSDWDLFTGNVDPSTIYVTSGTSASEATVNKDTVGSCLDWRSNLDGDDDLDTVLNCSDLCPGYDDFADWDGDGTPDGCDTPHVGVNALTTSNTRPTLTGTLDIPPGPARTDFCVTIGAISHCQGDAGVAIDLVNGTWSLNLQTANRTLAAGTYDVVAQIRNVAGTLATDTTTDELVIDTTAPTRPTVDALATSSTQPTLTGTYDAADLGPNATDFCVTVNAATRCVGSAGLTLSGGTWTWNLATAGITVPAGTYDVVATQKDAAGNTSSDNTTTELRIDTTAPTRPTVNTLVTSSTQPTLTGTYDAADLGPNATDFCVTVNAVTRCLGSAGLSLSGGAWTWNLATAGITVPAGTYDVTATQKDAAGNTSTDTTTNELRVDTTAPARPTVDALVTSSTQPTLTGTYDPDDLGSAADALCVTVDGLAWCLDATALTIDPVAGTWALDLAVAGQTVLDGTYDIDAVQRDDAGNTSSDLTFDELVVDTSPPGVPTVDFLTTSSRSPVVTGTYDASDMGAGDDALCVTVSAQTWCLDATALTIDPVAGTWALDLVGEVLADGVYDVGVTQKDGAGTLTSDVTTNELRIDTEAPNAPTVSALVTSNPQPTLTGTYDAADLGRQADDFCVTVNGATTCVGGAGLTLNGNGTWSLNLATAGQTLPDGTYDVSVTQTDAAGNSSSDLTTNEVRVDTDAPNAPTVSTLVTSDPQPTLTGTYDAADLGPQADDFCVTVNGATYCVGSAGLTMSAGTWSLNLATAGQTLPDGTYDVAVSQTDAAGNSASDATTNEIRIDTDAPNAPTVASLITSNPQPTLTGSYDAADLGPQADDFCVTVNGATYCVGASGLTLSAGTWSLNLATAGQTLPDGTYDVAVTQTDAAGNSTSDATTNEVRVDSDAPNAPTVNALVTSNPQATLTGSYEAADLGPQADDFCVTVNGATYCVGATGLTLSAGTWSLNLATAGQTLPDGTYDVSVTQTDAAGNTSSDLTTNEVRIDSALPTAPTVDEITTDDPSPVLTGTYDPADAGPDPTDFCVEVDGALFCADDPAVDLDPVEGTWSLDLTEGGVTLDDGTYDVVVSVTDDAGNTATDVTLDEVVIDTVDPSAPTVDPVFGNDPSPVLTGTYDPSDVGPDPDDFCVTVEGQTFCADDPALDLDPTEGTWSLDLDEAGVVLEDDTYDVVVTVTDPAGNTTTDGTTNEVLVDTTPPFPPPTVTSLLSSDPSPTIGGTWPANDMGADPEDFCVTVDGEAFCVGDPGLEVDPDGTWALDLDEAGVALTDGAYDVEVAVTDAADNRAIDTTTDEVVIDATPPDAPTVHPLVTSNPQPTLTGTWDPTDPGALCVTVDGLTHCDGDPGFATSDDGTWALDLAVAGQTLADGTWDVAATQTDAAGNSASDTTTDELVVDTAGPDAPTVDPIATASTQPVITGTYDPSALGATEEALCVTVDGATYCLDDEALAVDPDAGTWALDLAVAGQELAPGTYDVVVEQTDAAWNASTDATTDEVLVEAPLGSPPTPTVDELVTWRPQPVLTGTYDPAALGPEADDFCVIVDDRAHCVGDPGLTLDPESGTWSLDLIVAGQALADGTYDVVVEQTDAEGLVGADTTVDEVTIDRDMDSDGDGLSDADEDRHDTNPQDPDTDDDGLGDDEEVDLGTDPLDPDTDGGGVLDGEEVGRGTDPLDDRDDFPGTYGGGRVDGCDSTGGAVPLWAFWLPFAWAAGLRRRGGFAC